MDDTFDFLSSRSFKNGGDPFCYVVAIREQKDEFMTGSSTINVRFYHQAKHNFLRNQV